MFFFLNLSQHSVTLYSPLWIRSTRVRFALPIQDRPVDVLFIDTDDVPAYLRDSIAELQKQVCLQGESGSAQPRYRISVFAPSTRRSLELLEAEEYDAVILPSESAISVYDGFAELNSRDTHVICCTKTDESLDRIRNYSGNMIPVLCRNEPAHDLANIRRLLPGLEKLIYVTFHQQGEVDEYRSVLQMHHDAKKEPISLEVVNATTFEELREQLLSRSVQSLGSAAVLINDQYDIIGDIPAERLRDLQQATLAPLFFISDDALYSGAAGAIHTESQELAATFEEILQTPVFEATTQPWTVLGQLHVGGNSSQTKYHGSLINPTRRDNAADTVVDDTTLETLAFFQVLVLCTMMYQIYRRVQSEDRESKLRETLLRTSRITDLGYYNAAVAHQLSQPLGSMHNNIDAFLERQRSEGKVSIDFAREIIDCLHQDHSRICNLMASLRGLAKKQPLKLKTVDFKTLIAPALSACFRGVEVREPTISLQVPPTLPLVTADEILIQQVLVNLLNNAVEAIAENQHSAGNRRDFISIEARVDAEENERWTVVVTVSDSGIPFAEEHLAQAGQTILSTKPNGLGVGLMIACKIIEEHGGNLTISQSDESKSVSFSLPVAEGLTELGSV